jgi:hypothetical protein
MRSLCRIIVICSALCILIVPTGLKAESSGESPNLIGKWVGEYKAYFYAGSRITQVELRINQQDGPYFKGVNAWKHVDHGKPLTAKKGKPLTEDAEPVVGIIGFDGKSITIVEQDDLGTLHAELVGKDTMRLIYGEPGSHAAVFRVVLKRKP